MCQFLSRAELLLKVPMFSRGTNNKGVCNMIRTLTYSTSTCTWAFNPCSQLHYSHIFFVCIQVFDSSSKKALVLLIKVTANPIISHSICSLYNIDSYLSCVGAVYDINHHNMVIPIIITLIMVIVIIFVTSVNQTTVNSIIKGTFSNSSVFVL